jgi:hypothetical protein
LFAVLLYKVFELISR